MRIGKLAAVVQVFSCIVAMTMAGGDRTPKVDPPGTWYDSGGCKHYPCPTPSPCPECVASPCPEVNCDDCPETILIPECPPTPLPHIVTRTVTETVEVEVPAPARGYWTVPISLAYLQGGDLTTDFIIYKDPAIKIKEDATFGLGAGIGHVNKNRWGWSVQAFRFQGAERSAAWEIAPPAWLQATDPQVGDGDGRWAGVFTVAIPLGGK